jgi:uncharacterized protein YjiS (DUF1127 family)
MEMHSRQSLYEIHGIIVPQRRRMRWGRIARRAITRLLVIFNSARAAIAAELAARCAIEELAGMNDHMLRDLGLREAKLKAGRACLELAPEWTTHQSFPMISLSALRICRPSALPPSWRSDRSSSHAGCIHRRDNSAPQRHRLDALARVAKTCTRRPPELAAFSFAN